MTATYERSGLKFMYPETWKLTDQPDDPLPRAIALEAPDGGAMWAVHLYPTGFSAEEAIKEAIKPLRETYEDLEVSKSDNDFDQSDKPAFEAMFFCLDFLIRTKLQVISTPEYVLLFWYQGEDREFEKLEMVFKAISTSLLQSIDM